MNVKKPKHPLQDYDGYHAWLRAISNAEYEKESRRTYQYTEYLLHQIDEHDDSLEITDTFTSKKEALEALKTLEFRPDAVRAEVEKCVTKCRAIDFDTLHKDHTVIATRERDESATQTACR